jgi:hypothetical protein
MLQLPLGADKPIHIRQVPNLTGKAINTLQHCYGCTAGQGSSCTGAI